MDINSYWQDYYRAKLRAQGIPVDPTRRTSADVQAAGLAFMAAKIEWAAMLSVTQQASEKF